MQSDAMNRLRAAAILLLLALAPATYALPGRVTGWGNNELGQAASWNDPPVGATSIAAGGAGGLALMSNTTVIGWGDTTFRQDKPPLFLSNVVAVAMGNYHGLALVNNGTVVGWGQDGDGQAAPPGGLTNVTRVAAGGEHSLALRNDGVVIGWGKNNNGQASAPGFTNFTAIAAGDKFSVGLLSSGNIVAWGDNSNGQTAPSPSITGVVKIAAGERHGLALFASGLVAGWGDNSQGQASPPPFVSNVVAIAAGGKHSLALLNDGHVVAWGDTSLGQAAVPAAASNIIAIAAGRADSYALRSDGTIIRWGRANLLVKFPPGGIDDAMAIAGGGYHSLALRSNGSVVAWGDNEKGQCSVPGFLTNVSDIAAGSAHSIALANGGGVVAWGDNSMGQSTVLGGLTGIVDVAAGNFFSLALRPDGTIAHWGDTIAFPSPSITGVIAIAAGGYHGVGLQAGGNVVAWGDNSQGQSTVPGGLTGVVGVAAGEFFSMARLGDGSVVAWGNTNFNLTSPPPLSGTIDLAAGRQHAMALKSDGGIATWGDNFYQQIPAPIGSPPAMALEAGALHSLGIFSIPPTITGQPSNVVTTAGFISPFAVFATGTAPLQYQWRFNSAVIPGETQSTFIISNTQPTNGGSYDVIVSNVAGSVTSSAANLLVLASPSISSNPASQSVALGNAAAFGVAASGSAPLRFQWRQNGSLIGGATNSTFGIGIVAATNAGNYDVIVSNTVGSITSAAATLTVLLPPSISVQPASLIAPTGGVANFVVTASGSAPLFYQWVKGTPIGGAIASNYTIASVAVADAGNYFVIITNNAGSVTSAVAVLTVANPPTIATSPSSLSVGVGSNASLTVVATGTGSLAYQWRHNGTAIGGATDTTFSIIGAALADAGTYDVIVTNNAGSVTSLTATVTVLGAPQITTGPSTRRAWEGFDVTFTATAVGTAPLAHQWQFNDTDIANETNANLVLTSVSTGQVGRYRIIVSNPYGAVTSAPAILFVRSGAATGLRNDFDGDGKTDFALTGPVSSRWVRTIYVRGQWRTFVSKRHPISSAWFLMQSTAGYRSQEFGWTTDRAIPGDYDGDKRTDLAIYRQDTATWYIIDSSSGTTRSAVFGRPGAIPLSGDFDRDGVTDLAVYDRNSGDWIIQRSSDNSVQVRNWGWSGAIPVPGDYDGDNTTDLAVYDTAAGDWYIRRSGDGQLHRQNWGWPGADPAQGDYDGDGITDITAYDPVGGVWFVQRSGNGNTWRQVWGGAGGVPVPGDYDGDTIIDIAIFDPVLSTWSILKSSDGQTLGGGPQQFGTPDTKPAATQQLP